MLEKGSQCSVSYDLTLFQLREGADPERAWQELMQQDEQNAAAPGERLKRQMPESVRARMQQLADQLTSLRPSWEQFQPPAPMPWIELNDEQLQLQVIINERTVDITLPYFRPGAKEMMACVKETIRAIHAVTGYAAYDPQLGRVVTEADIENMLAQYLSVDPPETPAGLPQSPAPAKKPWWKFWV